MNKLYTIVAGASVALLGSSQAMADDVHVNSVDITGGSLCVGVDCVNPESFGADTIRLKENNLRIHFDDTSNSGSFPANDWRIVINDSANGGASYFAIEDSTASRTPFKILAGAPNNSIYVNASGNVGFGTATPAVDLHAVSGNTPTLRLEQDGSSGFTAQTWDVASNETNFFVRDVTNGSKLPFKIIPNAPNNSLYINASGNIGMGTASPSGSLHISHSGNVLAYLQSSDNNASQLRLRSDSTNRRILATNSGDTVKSQVVLGDDEVKLAGQTDNSDLYATFKRSGGHTLAYINNNTGGAAQLRLASDSTNRRILARDAADTVTRSQIVLGNSEVRLAGPTDANLYATFNASGMTLTGSTLTVNGTALNVPDYVFEQDYSLMPLTQLKDYVEENKHLPGIASAGDVGRNGMNVIDMQLQLLKKVEELTLYTLKQQETIDALHNKLAELEAGKHHLD